MRDLEPLPAVGGKLTDRELGHTLSALTLVQGSPNAGYTLQIELSRLRSRLEDAGSVVVR